MSTTEPTTELTTEPIWVLDEDDALDLLAFLVTAARMQVDEAHEYGQLPSSGRGAGARRRALGLDRRRHLTTRSLLHQRAAVRPVD